MSADKKVASDVPPRYLFNHFLLFPSFSAISTKARSVVFVVLKQLTARPMKTAAPIHVGGKSASRRKLSSLEINENARHCCIAAKTRIFSGEMIVM